MDYDIFLAPAADSWKVVERAEALGFRRAWFYDTQLLNAEVFVAMAAAAMQTSTIRLGTGVLDPVEPDRAGRRERARHASTRSRPAGSTSASPPASRLAARWGCAR